MTGKWQPGIFRNSIFSVFVKIDAVKFDGGFMFRVFESFRIEPIRESH
jgi:hypothetical protein